jgi:hypothetical protein
MNSQPESATLSLVFVKPVIRRRNNRDDRRIGVMRGSQRMGGMLQFSGYIEWDSERDRRIAEETKEPESPFDDPEVQRRIAEFIVRAAFDIKKQDTSVRHQYVIKEGKS